MLTKREILAVTAIVGLAVVATGTAFAGTITGTVTYEGKVPNLKPIAMDAEVKRRVDALWKELGL